MIKHGAIRAGETPSEVSGTKSETIKKGSAVRRDETPPETRIEDIDIPLDKPKK